MKTTCQSPSYFHPLLRVCLTGIFIVIISACGGGGSTGNTAQTTSVSINLPTMKQLAGSSITMPVTLQTKADVTAMQFDIDYDSAGITLDPTGIATILSSGHQVYASAISANRVRIVIAPTKDLLPITDGDVVSVPILLSNTATGDYTLKAINAILVGSDKKEMNDYSIQDGMVSVR